MGKVNKYAVRRVAGAVLTALYCVVALLNSTVVQSYLGAVAGNYFSQQWGGKVRIGALHASPLSHVVLDKIELVSPTGDTIYYGDRIACRFRRFPFDGDGLSFDRVYLRNGRYHLHIYRDAQGHGGMNLDYIIRYFADRATEHPDRPHGVFTVEVGELRLKNIDYIQDLPEPENHHARGCGVDIAHMRFFATNGVFRNVRVENDRVKVRVVSLTTTEASGQHVVDLSMDAEVSANGIAALNMDLQTDSSRVFMDARLDYCGWDDMADYCNAVVHDVVLKEGTEVNLCDAAYWAPVLWGMDSKVAVQGHIHGPVADLKAERLVASFGQSSTLFVDARISGLPDIDHATLDAVVHRLHTTYNDLAAVRHPEPIRMRAPDLIRQMAIIDLDGSIKGGMRSCEAWLNLNTMVGDLETHARFYYDTARHQYAYSGDVDSRWLGIHALLPNQWVSRTGMHLSFEGAGLGLDDMEAVVDGRLYNTVFRGKTIERTTFSAEMADGVLIAEVGLKDTLIALDLEASANLAAGSYEADLRLADARLTDLHLCRADSALAVSTRLHADVQGKDLEHLSALVDLDNTLLSVGQRQLHLNTLVLQANGTGERKQITVGCDWFRMNIDGWFAYAQLPLMAQDFCRRFVPAYYNPYLQAAQSRPTDNTGMPHTAMPYGTFSIDALWDDPEGSFADLLPGIKIANGTRLMGNYNPAESLKMVLVADSIRMNTISLHDVGMDAGTLAENYRMNIHAGQMKMGGMALMNNATLTAIVGTAISTLALKWGDRSMPLSPNDKRNCGDLELFMTSTTADNKIMVTKPDFYVMGQRWSLICPSGILVNDERIELDNFKIYGLDQSASVKAHIAGRDDDFATAVFDDFAIGQVCAILLADKPIGLQGTLDGKIDIGGLNKQPHFDANLVVDKLVVNNQPLGDMTIETHYSVGDARIEADIVSRLKDYNPIELHGYLVAEGRHPSIDIALAAHSVPLNVAEPFLASVADDMGGRLDCRIHVTGTTDTPNIEGSATLGKAWLKLAPTGVTYHIDDSVSVSGLTLYMNRLRLSDDDKNTAYINGTLDFGDKNQALNLQLHTDKITVLDKPSGSESFYGKLMASADGTLSGPLNSLHLALQAKAVEGSDVFVPISNRKQVSENEFIVFVSPNATRTRRAPARTNTSSGSFSLMANVSVTPGVTVHLPMDFDQLTANVTAVGRGDVQVTLNNGKQPNILGNYEFTSGNFSLSLLQLINKNFAIEEGSTLNFPGDINAARFNINAVYNQRVNLATLMGGQTSSSDTYAQVQDVITLEGTLQDPAIHFDIRMPNAEQSVADQVFSYIDRTNERDMLNQSISLLLLGRFNPAGTAESNDNLLGESTSINLLTSSASSIISNMVKVVDVNFKYQAGNGSAPGQFDVGISKQWERFYFESNFGYGNTTGAIENATSNVLVGDVEVGYKFNPYFNFYGFHRSNTSYYTRTEMPYKQGIGIKLTKDFDHLSEIFPWLRRRKQDPLDIE